MMQMPMHQMRLLSQLLRQLLSQLLRQLLEQLLRQVLTQFLRQTTQPLVLLHVNKH